MVVLLLVVLVVVLVLVLLLVLLLLPRLLLLLLTLIPRSVAADVYGHDAVARYIRIPLASCACV